MNREWDALAPSSLCQFPGEGGGGRSTPVNPTVQGQSPGTGSGVQTEDETTQQAQTASQQRQNNGSGRILLFLLLLLGAGILMWWFLRRRSPGGVVGLVDSDKIASGVIGSGP